MNAIDGVPVSADRDAAMRLRVVTAILAAQGLADRQLASNDDAAGLLQGVADAVGADAGFAILTASGGVAVTRQAGPGEVADALRQLVSRAAEAGKRGFDAGHLSVALPLPACAGAVGFAWRAPIAPAVVAALAPVPQAMAALLRLAEERRESALAERRLQLAMDMIGAAFAVFSPEDRLLAHNDAYLDTFPPFRALGTLAGRSFTELACHATGAQITPNPPAALEERLSRHQAADGSPCELQGPDGRWLVVHERRDETGAIVAVWRDVTRQKAGDRLLLDVLGGIDEGMFMLDPEQRLVMCNPRFREMNPRSAHMLSPRASFEAFLAHAARNDWFPQSGAAHPEFVAGQMEALRKQPRYRSELALGDGRWVLASHKRMTDGRVVGIWADVTEQRRREIELAAARDRLERQSVELARASRQLAQEARRDQLTALPNRLAFEERLRALPGERGGRPRPHYLLWMDLDHFKIVNDTSGHAAGDSLLRRLSALMQAELRPDDVLARLGGDEFAALLPNTTRASALRIAQALRRAVRAYRFRVEASSFSVDLSIGVARIDPAMDGATALACADKACFAAKDSGRGRVHVFQPDDETIRRAEETASWAPRLRDSLEEGRFLLYLQRINDADGRVLGFEALLRLGDESGDVRLPGTFLPPAKRLGLMAQLDQWVCEAATNLLTGASATGPFISVNLGARTIADAAFRQWFLARLDRLGMTCGRLRVEVTETDQFTWNGSEVGFLTALRARGVKLYVDDFGSGYNSFDLLKRLDVDGIKLDWAVTRDVIDDAVDRALVKAAVSIAESLRIELVAEGVETGAILDMLVSFGLKRFQGFYFHHPEPAAAALARLKDEPELIAARC